ACDRPRRGRRPAMGAARHGALPRDRGLDEGPVTASTTHAPAPVSDRGVASGAVAPARLRLRWLVAGVGAVVVAVVLGVTIGPVAISPGGVIRELLSHVPLLGIRSKLAEQQAAIVTQLRLPRVLLALLVGAMLSMAGASYQGVFRNP